MLTENWNETKSYTCELSEHPFFLSASEEKKNVPNTFYVEKYADAKKILFIFLRTIVIVN